MAAREKDGVLLTLCSACHNVIKQVNRDMKEDEYISSKVNNYIASETPYNGETKVIHYLEMLRDVVGFDKLREKVTNPLTGRKIGAYYGCLLLRPGNVMQMDDAENPKIIEDFIRAIGAEPVVYAKRNECCGGYMTMDDKAIAQKNALGVLNNADASGAEMLVTACPLCQYNLAHCGKDIPVVYFTELLAEALGLKENE